MEKAMTTYKKMVQSSIDNAGTGSGKVGILLPLDTPEI